MARFLGEVQGNRGEAHRLGHASSGLRVTAMSHTADMQVNLWVDAQDRDCVTLRIGPHGDAAYRCLYTGPIADLMDPDHRKATVLALAGELLAEVKR